MLFLSFPQTWLSQGEKVKNKMCLGMPRVNPLSRKNTLPAMSWMQTECWLVVINRIMSCDVLNCHVTSCMIN